MVEPFVDFARLDRDEGFRQAFLGWHEGAFANELRFERALAEQDFGDAFTEFGGDVAGGKAGLGCPELVEFVPEHRPQRVEMVERLGAFAVEPDAGGFVVLVAAGEELAKGSAVLFGQLVT